MERKYTYRFYFPMVGFHGSDFNKLCAKCQEKIDKILEEGYVLPCTISLDTSLEDVDGWHMIFSFQKESFVPCKKCQQALQEYIASAKFLRFGSNKSIELWRNSDE